MADHGYIARDKVPQCVDLRPDPGQWIVDAHGAAHDGHGPGPVQVVAFQLALVGAQHDEVALLAIQHGGEVAGRAEVRVGQYQDVSHGSPPLAQSEAKAMPRSSKGSLCFCWG
ncbi:hypothetical protein D3C81_1757310 [compost metagenome]